jgi:D-alanyl-D-alanine dipeptidase
MTHRINIVTMRCLIKIYKSLNIMKTQFSRLSSMRSLSIISICLTACFVNACKKDSAQPPPVPVIISGISPNSGAYNTMVTITGSGFSSIAAGDSVKFNGVAAVVQQASATQLVVQVPKAAGTGTVTVQTGSQTGTGPVFNFVYTIIVSTLAGDGTFGYADGLGSTAQFNVPFGLTTDAQGNVYVADSYNYRIRKITPSGIVSTLAGSGVAGFADGHGVAAQFDHPGGVVADGQGNIYVADSWNQRIRKMTPSGDVTTVAGSTMGFADGPGISAQFEYPNGMASDLQGNIYVADAINNRIRKITPAGIVSTLAGSTSGFADGSGTAAHFYDPQGVATDVQGNVYVADAGNHCIRKITPAGLVSTIAGNGTPGFADGNLTLARFYNPEGVATDAHGNIYVADGFNNRIREISPAGVVSTLAGSTIGYADGNGSDAKFYNPFGLARDAKGNIYVTDQNNRIRLITVQ